ncbi:MFS transporter [Micromonospora pisi]|uniref:MFS transporter n=1 Tax=Micromonospora pisi TaxID=589240 RepID=UPI001FE70095|nr:MFS transporter [Micromonospora pisi]
MEAPVSEATRTPEGPATFREVFAQPEFRALYTANAFSWLGDYLARAAVTVLVFQESKSVALSAAAFAVSFLPWLVGGPLLAAVAERHPYRNVMVICDLARMVLIGLIAIPGLPVPVILALLFGVTLANPPSQAARSALLPMLLTGDRLVVGLAVNTSTGQAAQIAGYVLGASVATLNPTTALLINTGTFALSATLIRFGIRPRAAAMTEEHRSHLLRETAEGFKLVFGTPVLRSIAVIVFASMLFAIVPEGLAAGWAAKFADVSDPDHPGAGLTQAMIMIASPVGFILGGLTIGRGLRPDVRRAMIRPFAVLAPLALVPALLNPTPPVVALMAVISGFAVAGLLPVANGLFVQALPPGFRARAFGVMSSGMQVLQGAAVLITGVLASRFNIPTVVGLWSIGGVLLMLVVSTQWPSTADFNAAIANASRQTRMGAEVRPAQRSAEESIDDRAPGSPSPQGGVSTL